MIMSKRETCRLCESTEIQQIFKMPMCPPVDNFRKVGEKEISHPSFPMDLYMCNACKHAQLLDVVNPDILYGNYIYTSSSSPDLNQHFDQYAEQMVSSLHLRPNAKILDVGSNDGLFLSKFVKRGFCVLGVDPSEYVAELANKAGIKTIVGFFTPSLAEQILQEQGPMDLVTANNVFSHADQLKEFAIAAHRVLSDGGTFVFEVSYLKDLVDRLVVDYIYHEHLCYHSILPLKQFLESCSLRLFDVQRVATKGGSIRCYAIKNDDPRPSKKIVDEMIQSEINSGLYESNTYKTLESRVNSIKSKLTDIFKKEIALGNKVASYGASATSTVLNSLLGIADFVSFIIDDNKERQNRLSPGFFIPVLSSAALLDVKPSITVISAWRFADIIMKRNEKYLKEGGRFIVPFPEVKEHSHATNV